MGLTFVIGIRYKYINVRFYSKVAARGAHNAGPWKLICRDACKPTNTQAS